jgi:hypothetical protein
MIVDCWFLMVEGKIPIHNLIDEKTPFSMRSRPEYVFTSEINNRHSSIANQLNLPGPAKPSRVARPKAAALDRTKTSLVRQARGGWRVKRLTILAHSAGWSL